MTMLRLFLLLMALASAAAMAAPRIPSDDREVLERLPARAGDAQSRTLRVAREQLARNPNDVAAAIALARRYYEAVAAEGDPRYIGYAQAALAPWWSLPAPPEPVRVMRAVLRQFGHDFEPSLADLRAVVQANPDNGEAWAWLAAIHMVQARYDETRAECAQLRRLGSTLIAAACTAAVDGVTGHAATGSQALHAALRAETQAEPGQRLWALTRLAEIELRRGDAAAAEAAFRAALALGITDGYLLAAYADFLLDRGRAAEVLPLLRDKERSDLLLLRLTLAAKATGAPEFARWSADLAARFDAARLRGDTVHQKEEARYALEVLGQPARALALAELNYAAQREPADARMLMEAALAARKPTAAAPALRWLEQSGFEGMRLKALAARLKAQS